MTYLYLMYLKYNTHSSSYKTGLRIRGKRQKKSALTEGQDCSQQQEPARTSVSRFEPSPKTLYRQLNLELRNTLHSANLTMDDGCYITIHPRPHSLFPESLNIVTNSTQVLVAFSVWEIDKQHDWNHLIHRLQWPGVIFQAYSSANLYIS